MAMEFIIQKPQAKKPFRMRKAQVDEVISPSRIGGTRIAELILA